LALTFWPLLMAVIVLAPWAFSRHRPRGEWWHLAARGAVSVGVCQMLFSAAQLWGNATYASVASALVPVVAAIAVARVEPLDRLAALGGAGALAGAVWFALARDQGPTGNPPAAAAAAALAVATAAWFFLHNRGSRAAPPSVPEVLARLWPQLLGATAGTGVVAFASGSASARTSHLGLFLLVGAVGYATPLAASVWMIPRSTRRVKHQLSRGRQPLRWSRL
jgi:drug/metabolite transporter (DMT)-like permease